MLGHKETEKCFFEQMGLCISQGDVAVGETYPIFGMITRFISEEPGDVVAEINFNIRARINLHDQDRLGILKERAFESGIFVSTVIAKEPTVEVECSTVIFGRRQKLND